MSSRPVDEKIVELQLDNEQFQQNAEQSIQTFQGMNREFNKSGSLDLSYMAAAIDGISDKFSLFGMIGVEALHRIASTAVDVGQKITAALTIKGAQDGLYEYNLKMDSVKTILNNTVKEGKTLKDVTASLDELNTYADKTIYSFSDMTRNMGLFTAAGVKLDDAQRAIMGLSNLAALGGISNSRAAGAMYQVSQALSAGQFRLMDWRSLENAGMASPEFREQLMQTARDHGIAIDSMIAKEGAFRETLRNGWLTSELFLETLSKYTDESTELGKRAYDAATKVSTFSKLIETTEEAIGSGWAQTWEIIIGDFDEATELFTKISTVVSDFVNKMSDARNQLLQEWSDLGGRDVLIKAFFQMFENIWKIVEAIGRGFKDVFGDFDALDLKNLTNKFRAFAKTLEPSAWTLTIVHNAATIFFSGLKVGIGIVSSFVDVFLDLVRAIRDSEAYEKLGQIFFEIGESLRENDGINVLTDMVKNLSKLNFDVFGKIADGFSKIWDVLASLMPSLGTGGVIALIVLLGKTIKDFVDKLSGINILEVVDKIKDVFDFKEMTELRSKAVSMLLLIGGLALIAHALVELSEVPSEKIITSLATLGVVFKMLSKLSSSVSGTFGTLSGFGMYALQLGLSMVLMAWAVKIIGGIKTEDAIKGLVGIGILLKMVNEFSLSYTHTLALDDAAGIILMAIGIDLMAGALAGLSYIPFEKLATGLAGLGGLLTEISIFSKSMQDTKMVETGASMILLGIGLTGVATALGILSLINPERMVTSLMLLGGALAEISFFAGSLSDTKMLETAGSMVLLGFALNEMAIALGMLALINPERMVTSLILLGGALAEISMFAGSMQGTKMLETAGSMIILGVALNLISVALKMLSTIDPGGMVVSLVMLAATLTMIDIALTGMQGNLVGALAFIGLSAGILMLAGALKTLSSISPEQMAVALVGMAAALIILGGALWVLQSASVGSLMLIAILGTFAIVLVSFTALLAEVVNVMGMLGDSIGKFDFAAALEEICTQIANSIGVLVKFIADSIRELAENLQPLIDSVFQLLINLFNGLATALTEQGPQLIEALDNFLIALLQFIMDWLADLFTKLWDWLNSEGLASAVSAIGTIIGNILGAIGGFFVDMWNQGQELVRNFFDGINNWSEEVSPKFEQWLQDCVDAIAGFIPAFFTGGLDIISAIWDGIQDGIGDFAGSIGDWLFGGGEDQSQSEGAGAAQGESYKRGVDSKQEEVRQSGVDLANKGKEGAESVKTDSTGENFSKGMANGITSGNALSWLDSAARAAARRAKSAAESELKERSPSREGVRIGSFFSIGLANGIIESAERVYDASSSMAQRLLDSVTIIANRVSDNLSVSPTITPVVKMDSADVDSLTDLNANLSIGFKDEISGLTEVAERIERSNSAVMNKVDMLIDRLETTKISIELQPQQLDGEVITDKVTEITTIREILENFGKGKA